MIFTHSKPQSVHLILSAAIIILANCTEVPSKAPAQPNNCMARAYGDIGGPFSLVDHTGRSVSEVDFTDKPNLLFFGFTDCPDVCPLTLAKLQAAFDLMPENITRPRTLLISVDPERDTPETLARYISIDAFPDDIVGLTGTTEDIKAVSDAFYASFSRIEDPQSATGYTLSHSSIIYLMDENWQLKSFFTGDASVEDIGQCLNMLLDG